jgi:hypothetical protein
VVPGLARPANPGHRAFPGRSANPGHGNNTAKFVNCPTQPNEGEWGTPDLIIRNEPLGGYALQVYLLAAQRVRGVEVSVIIHADAETVYQFPP